MLAMCSGALLAPGKGLAAVSDNTVTVTSDADRHDGYTIPTTSVASKAPVARLDEAQSVSTVTQQQLDDYRASSVSDAMRFVSGVSEATPWQARKMALCGAVLGVILMGLFIATASAVAGDSIWMPPRNASRCLKGSASLLYGIQNPGGIINVISKKPQYSWHSAVTGRYASEGGGAGTLDVTGPLGNGVAFRLIAEKQRQDYWRNFGSDEHSLLAPSLQWYGEKASLLISYSDYRYDIPYDRGTAFINGSPLSLPYKQRLDDKANHAWGRNQALNAHYDWQFNDSWSTRLTLGWNQRRYDNNEVRVTAIDPASGVVTRRADANRGFNQKTKYVSWDVLGNPELFGMTHALVFGTDYEMNQTYRAHQYQGKNDRRFNLFQSGL
ncbi:TonB-dependent receptor [Pantoea ananatis]